MLPDAPVGQRLDDPDEMRELAPPSRWRFRTTGTSPFPKPRRSFSSPGLSSGAPEAWSPQTSPRGDAGAAHDIALHIRGKSTERTGLPVSDERLMPVSRLGREHR